REKAQSLGKKKRRLSYHNTTMLLILAHVPVVLRLPWLNVCRYVEYGRYSWVGNSTVEYLHMHSTIEAFQAFASSFGVCTFSMMMSPRKLCSRSLPHRAAPARLL